MLQSCKYKAPLWTTRILVGVKKKKTLHRRICSITSPLSESLKLILSMPQSTTALRFYIVSCAVDYSQVLSLLKNENTLFESCYSLINFFFVNSLFLEAVGCSQSYICWRNQRFCRPGFQPCPCDWWMTSVWVRTETCSTWIPVAEREEQYWPNSCNEVSYALTA